MTTILNVERLSVRFRSGGETINAVRDVSLSVGCGECVGIVGESGSGKTVTFMAAMGLLAKDALVGGRIRFADVDMLASVAGNPDARALNQVRGSRMAMIFQDPMTSLTPHLTIGTQLAEVLVTHARLSWQEAGRAALGMLERVRIPDPRRRFRQYPHELSGGMRQRVMIGMSLLCNPSLLIADEPTTALDVTVQAEILSILRLLRAEIRMATVIISHDLGVIGELADRVIVMYAGRLVECADARTLLQRAAHPYTVELVRCLPNLRAARLERMPTLPGTAPSAADTAPGCAFAARCARARDRCRTELPPLRATGVADQQAACHFPVSA